MAHSFILFHQLRRYFWAWKEMAKTFSLLYTYSPFLLLFLFWPCKKNCYQIAGWHERSFFTNCCSAGPKHSTGVTSFKVAGSGQGLVLVPMGGVWVTGWFFSSCKVTNLDLFSLCRVNRLNLVDGVHNGFAFLFVKDIKLFIDIIKLARRIPMKTVQQLNLRDCTWLSSNQTYLQIQEDLIASNQTYHLFVCNCMQFTRSYWSLDTSPNITI